VLKIAKKVAAKAKERGKWRVERRPEREEASGGVLDLMERVSPELYRPVHFELYAKLFETAIGGEHRVVFSAPPQHGKTQTTLHGLAWLILKYPNLRHAYITYSQERANSVSLELQSILRSCGVIVSGTLNKIRWAHGKGSIMMVGIQGGITGEPIDGLCVLDDVVKNIQEATSPTTKAIIDLTYKTSVALRVHEGCSIFIMATRWDVGDLSGTSIKSGVYREINIPAIAEENDILGRAIGEPLFPDLWSLAKLNAIRHEIGELSFSAMYQGRPRPMGGTIFKEPSFHRSLPIRFTGAFGVDLAYTDKTSGDWSVCAEMLKDHDTGRRCIKHVDMAKVEADVFALTLKRRHLDRPSWKMLWRFGGGGEKGVAKFIRKMGVPLRTKKPPGDKYVSALDIAAAWNRGDITLPDLDEFPEAETWVGEVIRVCMGFTGSDKEEDDIVDALGAADYALQGKLPEDRRELPGLRM
jgi:hypothetical protein